MASQQPPLPSWAPEGAQWSSATYDDAALQDDRPRHVGLKLVALLVLPLVLLLGGAYVVEHYVLDRYTVVKPDSLLNMPHVSAGADAAVSGIFHDGVSRELTVTAYATDADHVLLVATRVGRDLVWRDDLARAMQGAKGVIDVPTDGYGGAGRCARDGRGSLCVFANDGSFVLVGEQRVTSLDDAAVRARAVHRTVLRKKRFRF